MRYKFRTFRPRRFSLCPHYTISSLLLLSRHDCGPIGSDLIKDNQQCTAVLRPFFCLLILPGSPTDAKPPWALPGQMRYAPAVYNCNNGSCMLLQDVMHVFTALISRSSPRRLATWLANSRLSRCSCSSSDRFSLAPQVIGVHSAA